MDFSLKKSIEILDRTPDALDSLLSGVSPDWTMSNEGGDTWSAYDVVGHLIHGELTDWIPRAKIILTGENNRKFHPFDRFAQFEESKGKTLSDLLREFRILRKNNLRWLINNVSDEHLGQTGIHPDFGEVSLSQLLATWTVHDLTHIAQISRVIAKQYKEAVGPWLVYLRVLKE
jgi:hypothetical protein